jgi:hypothetical protein
MTTIITEVYDALRDAGASEDKAIKAAAALSGYDSQIARVDAKLTIAMWAGGLLFAALLASQATLWISMGSLDGQIKGIANQLTQIAQLVRH